MKINLIAAFILMTLMTPSFAQDPAITGDTAKGQKEYNKCRACHKIQTPDGEAIVKGGLTGPNLFGVVGRPIASEANFKYGAGITKLAEAFPDAVWDIQSIKAYVTDPTAYLQKYSGDPKARSKMTFKLTRNQDDLVAYLASISPDAPRQPHENDGSPRPAAK